LVVNDEHHSGTSYLKQAPCHLRLQIEASLPVIPFVTSARFELAHRSVSYAKLPSDGSSEQATLRKFDKAAGSLTSLTIIGTS